MIPSETRERFIVDLNDQLAGVEIMEAHFFAPRRVSGVESGIAVVAAAIPAPPEESPLLTESGEPADVAPADESPYAEEREAPLRYTVFTAAYRQTLKGPDRGKWEVTVKAEAEAPLVTVDQVVRGVQRRAEETDEVERMTGDEIRAVIDAHQPAVG